MHLDDDVFDLGVVFQSILPLSETVVFLHGPFSKALRAALTARSISSFSPLGTWVKMPLLEGSRTSKVFPLVESTRLPSIDNFCGEARKFFTADTGSGVVVMAIPNKTMESKIQSSLKKGLYPNYYIDREGIKVFLGVRK